MLASPAEMPDAHGRALALLQENEKFVDELTDLALRYIEDAVCSIEIPPITGEKDWGNYRIAGLAVKRFTVVSTAKVCYHHAVV